VVELLFCPNGVAIMDTFHKPELLIAVVAVASMLFAFAPKAVAQTAPTSLPAAVMCYAQADQSWRVGYLFRVNKNGEALYISPDGRLSATVDAKGMIAAPKNRAAGIDCYGKTLEEMRADGRTLDFQRQK
jgi:hypothetical protein